MPLRVEDIQKSKFRKTLKFESRSAALIKKKSNQKNIYKIYWKIYTGFRNRILSSNKNINKYCLRTDI